MQEFEPGSDVVVKARFMTHAYRSLSTSSTKVRNARNYASMKLNSLKSGNFKRHITRKKNRKKFKLNGIPEVTPKQGIDPSIMKSNPHFFESFYDDPVFGDLLSEYNACCVTVNVYEKMNLVDSLAGSKLMESDSIPIFVQVPRQQVLYNTSSAHADIQCLKSLLLKHQHRSKRGTKRNGLSLMYATLGAHCQRYKSGIHIKKIHQCCQNDYAHLKKMVARVELFSRMFLPFGLLSTLKEMKKMCGRTACLDSSGVENEKCIWASIATSYNYVSPAHTDEDAFLSCLTVSYVPIGNGNKKYFYKLDMPVAVYFCIPEFNIAVGLRPGDVIFFNPLHYHCVSQRTEDYAADEIFVTSFYMKSKQLGGNDNNLDKFPLGGDTDVFYKIPNVEVR